MSARPTGAGNYYYAHLDSYAPGLAEGAGRCRQGDPIGRVGSTGDASPDAPHLHFAINRMEPGQRWWQGSPINPYPLLAGTRPARLKRRAGSFHLSSETDMKISGVDIRPGNIIEYEGGIWRAVKIQHTQPGKGGAYMQVEMKNLIDGRKNNVRFRSAETVERVRLDTKDFQFLFTDGDMLDLHGQGQLRAGHLPRRPARRRRRLPPGRHGRGHGALRGAADLGAAARHDRGEIVEADAVVKGQTASSSYKPAILDNGVRVMVPPHISAGTRIVVDVYEQTYVRRAD